jgi:hypothetical protein
MVNPPTNQAPVTSGSSVNLAHGNANPLASTLFSVNDGDGDTMTAYRFWDGTGDASSGYFVVDSVAQGAYDYIDVSAAQLAQTTFQTGIVADDFWVQAYDGQSWSNWAHFMVNPPLA